MGFGEDAGLINQSLLLRMSRGNAKAALNSEVLEMKVQECDVQCSHHHRLSFITCPCTNMRESSGSCHSCTYSVIRLQ